MSKRKQDNRYENSNNRSGLRTFIVLIILIILSLIFYFSMFGLDGGTGDGMEEVGGSSSSSSNYAVADDTSVLSSDSTAAVSTASTADSTEVNSTSTENGASASSELPQEITVTIHEDEVYVEDRQISDAEELREYLEEINTDGREYRLNDEDSILETYEWVHEVFEELNITLVEEAS